MPRHFDDRMIDDVVWCIRNSDVIGEDAKARLVARVLSLRQPHCSTVPSCGNCSKAERCEDHVGAILNGEDIKTAEPANHGSLLRLVVCA